MQLLIIIVQMSIFLRVQLFFTVFTLLLIINKIINSTKLLDMDLDFQIKLCLIKFTKLLNMDLGFQIKLFLIKSTRLLNIDIKFYILCFVQNNLINTKI